MAQKVIAARDFELYLTFNAIGTPIKIGTGANFSSVISGQTDSIGAFSTDEPIGTDNGGNTYDISFSIQTAEWITIMDAVRAATAATDHPIVHIRDIVESLTITAVWNKRNDVPATSTTKTFTSCTGVEESDDVERRGTETLQSLRFRARGMAVATTLL